MSRHLTIGQTEVVVTLCCCFSSLIFDSGFRFGRCSLTSGLTTGCEVYLAGFIGEYLKCGKSGTSARFEKYFVVDYFLGSSKSGLENSYC